MNSNKISPSLLIIIASIFFIIFDNLTFFQQVSNIYPLSSLSTIIFIASLAIVFSCVNIIILSLLCYRYTIKPVLITLLLVSAASAYFMDSYHVIIDDVMIDNIVKTDIAEARDLMSLKQCLYLFLLGVLPSIYIYKVEIVKQTFKKAIISKTVLVISSLLIAVICILSLGDFYALFLRENKSLRNYSNPSYYIYSLGKYVSSFYSSDAEEFTLIGQDAHISDTTPDRELIIVVVGETARADHFSLNGYSRKTNPNLEQQDIINFNNVWSCGTSTAVSVPCMFAHADHSSYDGNKAKITSNLLDISELTGANILWLDNNSSSKGVADRVDYQNYKKAGNKPLCDTECRDIGMLSHLQSYIDAHPDGDIVIVLHQMGNHGPAYYKRYPQEFERFTPTCKTNQLEQCSAEEINNAYDNAILYTDYFLSETINLLKQNDDNFETVMVYASDHGESLGENGLYLHGLPYLLAPDSQKHVPMIMWFGKNYELSEYNRELLEKKSSQKYSHDNLFHTLLGMLEIETESYDAALDIIPHED